MRKSSHALIIVTAAVLVMQPLLFAKQEGHKQGGDKKCQEQCMGKHHSSMFECFIHMQKELGLTDEQIQSIADINKNHMKENARLP